MAVSVCHAGSLRNLENKWNDAVVKESFLWCFISIIQWKQNKLWKQAEDAGKQKRTKHLQLRSSASAHCSPTLTAWASAPAYTHTHTQAIKSKVFFVMWPMKLWLSKRESLVFVYQTLYQVCWIQAWILLSFQSSYGQPVSFHSPCLHSFRIAKMCSTEPVRHQYTHLMWGQTDKKKIGIC